MSLRIRKCSVSKELEVFNLSSKFWCLITYFETYWNIQNQGIMGALERDIKTSIINTKHQFIPVGHQLCQQTETRDAEFKLYHDQIRRNWYLIMQNDPRKRIFLPTESLLSGSYFLSAPVPLLLLLLLSLLSLVSFVLILWREGRSCPVVMRFVDMRSDIWLSYHIKTCITVRKTSSDHQCWNKKRL